MAAKNTERGAMDVKAPPTEFKPNNRKTSTSTEDRRNYQYGAGGDDAAMFKPQSASTQVPGHSGKQDIRGPGEQFTDGGDHPTGFSGALPAKAGQSGADNNTDLNYRENRQRVMSADRFGSNDAPAAKPHAEQRPSRMWDVPLKQKNR